MKKNKIISLTTLSNPESLTNEIIQALGNAYLESHPKKGANAIVRFFDKLNHDNHPVANELKNYAENSTNMTKWYFLATIFAKLHRSSGELSLGLLQLFRTAFNSEPTTHLLINSQPALGDGFDTDDCELDMKSLHKWFSSASTGNALSSFLDVYYYPDFKIKAQKLGVDESAIDAGIQIPGDLIHKIGNAYLNKHPSESIMHRNQDAANKMTNVHTPESTFKSWMDLADAYKNLYASYGELSRDILGEFCKAFGKTPYTYYIDEDDDEEYLPPETVSWAMKQIVMQHYSHAYQAGIKAVEECSNVKRQSM